MRFAIALLFTLCLCLPASAQCSGGSCGLRPARAAARGVKSLAGRVREAKPVRRVGGRILDVLTPRR